MGRCATKAINDAVHWCHQPGVHSDERRCLATYMLAKTLSPRTDLGESNPDYAFTRSLDIVQCWNDGICLTAEQAVMMLRTAAAGLEEEGTP